MIQRLLFAAALSASCTPQGHAVKHDQPLPSLSAHEVALARCRAIHTSLEKFLGQGQQQCSDARRLVKALGTQCQSSGKLPTETAALRRKFLDPGMERFLEWCALGDLFPEMEERKKQDLDCDNAIKILGKALRNEDNIPGSDCDRLPAIISAQRAAVDKCSKLPSEAVKSVINLQQEDVEALRRKCEPK